ncbi:MAG: regulatory protein RecX [Pseudomonadales bacterium]|nr:regulatory protein RecX [Pseudomonadales bacterium]
MEAKTEVKPSDIRRAAMDLLARREHSRLELHEKLSRRFAGCQELIQSETEKLTAEGLQSDARLAEAYVRARSNRGQGPRKIRMELRQRASVTTLFCLPLTNVKLTGLSWRRWRVRRNSVRSPQQT